MARILIAEDDDTLRELLVRALGEDGHVLTESADGALATGRNHPDIAIMLMTGYAEQRERAHGLDALVQDVIFKPFSIEQIKGAVREALVLRH
jgi:CheY-like chemotaxis protein